MSEYRTGRIVHHDPASREYAYRRAVTRPASVLHTLDAKAMDQGYLGACTGFAAAQWLNCSANRWSRSMFNYTQLRMRNYYVRDDHGVLLYRKATEEDDFGWVYPPQDYGSSGLGVAKALKKFRAIERYEWTFDFDSFLAAAQRQPVLVGTVWTQSMFDPDRLGIIRATGSFDEGGHEYLVRGVRHVPGNEKWGGGLVRIRNSWSPAWGLGGDAYIPFSDMRKLLAAQGDCVVPIALGK